MGSDSVAQFSGPITAYMSGLPDVNLAYVRYFGKKHNAIQATFTSLNAQGFTATYATAQDAGLQVFIPWPQPPLTERGQIRPALEAMADEAQKALGMPSSLHGPPPIAALARAAAAEEAMGRTSIYDSADHLDKFEAADLFWQVTLLAGMWSTWFLTQPREMALAKAVQQMVPVPVIQWIWRMAVGLHVGEAVVACGICVRRGWYSTSTTAKWTFSTLLFGFASMKKLVSHGKQKNH
ncbi:hypothetical protein DM01DRAFT_1385262 [Hesseltinella vesiculosa]|uniref:DUF2470 domain-containing protein n=1 Tax=Hesseltinella vesiculosa TaxID=101127 RepID=A0A1X2GAF7_9FUNG|nr:hypothetical protein DM01DRAFT_1385262 [Hesseltinella vesiculosa]